MDLLGRFKQAIAKRAVGVVLCEAAKAFHPSAHVIPNPYDSRLFREITPSASRSRDLIFVGRLVSEKGVDVLLQGLRFLADSGLHPTLTIVGKGDERAKLESLTGELGLSSQVSFLGARTGESLVREMNEHRIMVVPSRYDEPFGVVALEGIACGCALVGSEGGGLPAAIGPCGRTFPNGDARALATVLGQLLSGNDRCLELTRNAPRHLAKFGPSAIADAYLEVFKSVLR
jgi:glycosyltransferase involved in cell wall biosynthesis